MPPKPKPKIMPLFARGYHLWCAVAVLIVGVPAIYYASSAAAKLLPGGELDTAPYVQAMRDHEAALAGARTLRAAVQSVSREDQLRLAALVPQDKETPSLITNLSNLTAAQGVTLKSIDAAPDATPAVAVPGSVGTIAVALTLKGLDYPGLKRYLTATADNARLLDFVSVSFSPKTPELTLQLRTYYLQK